MSPQTIHPGAGSRRQPASQPVVRSQQAAANGGYQVRNWPRASGQERLLATACSRRSLFAAVRWYAYRRAGHSAHRSRCVAKFCNGGKKQSGPTNAKLAASMCAADALPASDRPDFESKIKPVITTFLATKAEQWAYEQEARYISFESGLVQFERDWLRQICFGLNTSRGDRTAVIEAVKRLRYTNCGFVEVVHSQPGRPISIGFARTVPI